MDNIQMADKWLRAFAFGVPQDKLEKYVYDHGNLLWHIFSWELVECISGDEARAAFDELDYHEAICFRSGYSRKDIIVIEGIHTVSKVLSSELENVADVFVTAPDFTWTYVHTHEKSCGPYFCRKT